MDKNKKELENEQVNTENQASEQPKEDTGQKKENRRRRDRHAKHDDQTETLQELGEKLAETNDKYVRLYSEYENYRKRTTTEKAELIINGSKDTIKAILPVVDDFERARDAMAKTEDINSLREGIDLIYNKFIAWLDKQDVHAIDTTDADFNTDEHEAITTFAAGEEKKGKIIDCTQTGYKHGERVIRFAKVVVGE